MGCADVSRSDKSASGAGRFTGPVISLLVHIVVIALLVRFVTAKLEERTVEIEISVSAESTAALTEPSPMPEAEPVDEAPDLPTPEIDIPVPTMADTPTFDAFLSDVELTSHEIDLESSPSPLKSLPTAALPPSYTGRSAEKRRELVRKHGGSEAGQNAVLRALEWLKSVQSENGSWANKPAHTALALLCFLAHGETPESEAFGNCVGNAMRFLVSSLPPRGRLAGKPSYVNGITTYALAEAIGMTRLPYLRETVESGLRTIVDGQQAGGGYDYKYRQGQRWDLSIAGWQIQAMKAGTISRLSVPGLDAALARSVVFVKASYADGKFGYSTPGTGGNMTAVGALCLQLLGAGDSSEARGAIHTLRQERLKLYESAGSRWSELASKHLYGWYYSTQAMFNRGGKDWDRWNTVYQDVLVRNQQSDGHWEVGKAMYGFTNDLAGHVYCTTLCCLQLEVYYRRLPSLQASSGTAYGDNAWDITDDDPDSGLIIR